MAGTLRVFKFRLYPTSKQELRLSRTVEVCRRLWNDALAHRKNRWDEQRLSTSYNLQNKILTAERNVDSKLREVCSQVAQDVLRRLDSAFRAFFEHREGYPRFKESFEFGSFTYPQAYNGSAELDEWGRRISLSKIGRVRIIQHRPVPTNGKLKICTVKREPDGKWYALLVYEGEMTVPQGTGTIRSPVGIDLGLKSIIATSEGQKVDPPQFLKKAEKKLRRLHKSLSAKQRGSKNRNKAKRRLAIQHSKVKNQRADFNHKLSSRLVEKHDFIAFENLQINNLLRNHAVAKSVNDAGWGQLIRMAEYKAYSRGKMVVKVPAQYTTQECDFCSVLNKVPLDVREFECTNCQRALDRDVNGARIVLKRALAQVGQGMPELKPVETGPPPPRATKAASLAKEAGTRCGDLTSQQQVTAGTLRHRNAGGCHPRRFTTVAKTRDFPPLLSASFLPQPLQPISLEEFEKRILSSPQSGHLTSKKVLLVFGIGSRSRFMPLSPPS